MIGSDLQTIILLWELFNGSYLAPMVVALVFTFGFILHDALSKSNTVEKDRESLTGWY